MDPSALTALAMLKVNWDQHRKSYLDSFLPFISAILSRYGDEGAEPNQIRESLISDFGLTLPFGTVESLVRRGRDTGLYKQRGRLFTTTSAGDGADIWVRRNEILHKQQVLLNRFIQYSSREFGTTLSIEEAEDRLLRQVEMASVPVLKTWLRGEPLAGNAEDVNPDYATSSFIINLYNTDPAGLSDLEDIVKGNMLASALYYTPNLRNISSRFSSTSVVLDTPILLRSLGYEGPAEQAAALNTLNLAGELGAQLVCFDRTLDELKRVMSGISHALTPGARVAGDGGPARAHFLAQRATPSDIELLIGELESNLRAVGVRVISRPQHTSSLAISEERLESILQAKVRYKSNLAMLHDLDVLTAIYRMRSGEAQHSLERCKAIFITPNIQVVRSSREYFEGTEEISPSSWPLALLDHIFATVLWLKLPQQASDLPRKQLIANSYAGLVPSTTLWNKYLTELDKLAAQGGQVERNYAYLRYSLDAQQLLMKQTLGDEKRLNEGTIYDIIADVRKLPDRSSETGVPESEDEATIADDAAAVDIISIATMERERAEEAMLRAEAAERQLTAMQLTLNRTASVIASVVAALIGATILAALCTVVWIGLPSPIGPSLAGISGGWRAAIKILAIVGAFLILAVTVLGGSARSVFIATRSRVKRRLLRMWAKDSES